ncbi:MAG: transcription elongation factor GreA [Mycobacteriales bacterium]
MTENAANVTWLTQEAYDRLKQEHETLVKNRPAMAAEINDRREEGDLRENGGYHAAKDEQGKQEARIRHLEDLLRTAKVGEAPTDDGVAGQGMVVTVLYEGEDETETFLIGSREESDTTDIPVYSPASPIGKALTGARPGASREYELPNGTRMKVKLENVQRFTG